METSKNISKEFHIRFNTIYSRYETSNFLFGPRKGGQTLPQLTVIPSYLFNSAICHQQLLLHHPVQEKLRCLMQLLFAPLPVAQVALPWLFIFLVSIGL